jgi:Zn-finger nucleic acid-binding protein
MVFDKLKCLDCGSLMIEEEHHGVTIDRCISCGSLWFDVDEIYAYLEAHPAVATANEPSETDFRKSTRGVGGFCNCCGQSAIELGDFRGIAYQRCTWCGGIFIGWEQIRQILASRAGQVTVWGPEDEFAPATAAVVGAAAVAVSDTEQTRHTGDRVGEALSGVGDTGLEVLASGVLDSTGEATGWVLETVLEFVFGAIAGALGG